MRRSDVCARPWSNDMKIQRTKMSLAEIGRSAHVAVDRRGASTARTFATIATATLLAPVSFLVGVALLSGGGLPRLFSSRGSRLRRHEKERSLDVEVLSFSARGCWWLRGNGSAHHTLMLHAGGRDVVLLGTGWPDAWVRRRGLFHRWLICRRLDDAKVLGVRAWGRATSVSVAPAADDMEVGERALIRPLDSLPLHLVQLVSPSGPYR